MTSSLVTSPVTRSSCPALLTCRQELLENLIIGVQLPLGLSAAGDDDDDDDDDDDVDDVVVVMAVLRDAVNVHSSFSVAIATSSRGPNGANLCPQGASRQNFFSGGPKRPSNCKTNFYLKIEAKTQK